MRIKRVRHSADEITRFWAKVKKTETCWFWTAGTDGKRGYGHFHRKLADGSHTIKAHRYSYELVHGPIPDGLMVCHTCDNPLCVNPDHLFLGTAKDNAKDRDVKGRSATNKLTAVQVQEIKDTCNVLQLAEQYDVSPHTIIEIMMGKSWKHVSNKG